LPRGITEGHVIRTRTTILTVRVAAMKPTHWLRSFRRMSRPEQPHTRDTPESTRRGPDRSVVVLACITSVLTYGLIVLGSTVRVTNSGMGCPSWPLCYGHFTPVDEYHALLEQSHRYLVSVVTVAVLLTALAAYRSHTRRDAFAPAAVGVGLIVFQAALGAVTVFAKNAPWTVAVHLVVAFVFFAATIVTTVVAVRGHRGRWTWSSVGRWGWIACGVTLALVVVGTVVVGTGAGDDCPSWPLCTHSAPDGMIAWQLVHRSVAGIAGIALVGFVLHYWRASAGWISWRIGATALVALLVAAAAFGAASALTRASEGWQDVHLALAAALWGTLVTLVAMLSTGTQDREAPRPTS
jgi:heme A synthase